MLSSDQGQRVYRGTASSITCFLDGQNAAFVCRAEFARILLVRYQNDQIWRMDTDQDYPSLPYTPMNEALAIVAAMTGTSADTPLQITTLNDSLVTTMNANTGADPRCQWRDAHGGRVDPRPLLEALDGYPNVTWYGLEGYIASNREPLIDVPANTKIRCFIYGFKEGVFGISVPQFDLYYVSVVFNDDDEPMTVEHSTLLAIAKAMELINAIDPALTCELEFITDHSPTIELMTNLDTSVGHYNGQGADDAGDPVYDADIIIPIYNGARPWQNLHWVLVDNHHNNTDDLATRAFIRARFESIKRLLRATLE